MKPLIFRATSQFFLDLSRDGLKDRVLSQVGGIRWVPSWGRDRMHNMMSARPDWCLSRQRSWGVALPALVCRSCGQALLDPGIARGAAEVIAGRGSDAWFEMSAESVAAMSDGPAECAGCGSSSFERVDDILDVWFDSSLSHFNVLTEEYGLSRPADVYLEATDQHRGWFGVSMLTSEALGTGIPARTIITHGLILDEQGKKMSKSLGNAISPLEIIETMGADILRLWFASVDYTADFRADRAMLEDAREAYRKLRNTIRFMLGNLDEGCAGSFEATGLDRYMELRFREVQSACVEAYRAFQFHKVHKELRNLATTDLSGLFLDVRKDRLYCDPPDSVPAGSTRALTGWMTVELLKLLAPVIPFTAEEAWLELPPALRTTPSVHTAEFDLRPLSDAEREELVSWEPVLEVRRAVLKKLEEARASGLIGGSLEAHVSLTLPPGLAGSAGGEDWAGLLIVSTVSVEEGEGIRAEVVVSPHARCARCWRRMPEVPARDGEPLCRRCAGAVGTR
jgi:isoleucyl-tRNA synthetase